MIEFRLRSKVSQAELDQKVGKVLTPRDFNVLLCGPTFVRKPDGRPLAVYLPNVLTDEAKATAYPVLHEVSTDHRWWTDNRGLASGMPRAWKDPGKGGRTRTLPVPSTIVGAFDAGNNQRGYCRLTAWTGRELPKFQQLEGLLCEVGDLLAKHVPDRHRNQMQEVRVTQPEWVIPGTPFTTVTVNNTYPTGVHTDKGDLDQGFSTIACLRRGDYSGGHLVFPEYRVAVDMHDGDVLLMDAHEWHGNTFLDKRSDDAERISVVSYFRTRMVACGTAAEEQRKAEAYAAKRSGLADLPS